MVSHRPGHLPSIEDEREGPHPGWAAQDTRLEEVRPNQIVHSLGPHSGLHRPPYHHRVSYQCGGHGLGPFADRASCSTQTRQGSTTFCSCG
jgi:hypothetical protein